MLLLFAVLAATLLSCEARLLAVGDARIPEDTDTVWSVEERPALPALPAYPSAPERLEPYIAQEGKVAGPARVPRRRVPVQQRRGALPALPRNAHRRQAGIHLESLVFFLP